VRALRAWEADADVDLASRRPRAANGG